jgi:hypothetical protein
MLGLSEGEETTIDQMAMHKANDEERNTTIWSRKEAAAMEQGRSISWISLLLPNIR